MLIVIADTTPVNHLILLDRVELLNKLYHQVIIPQAVLHELQVAAAPQAVRKWAGRPPHWLDVRQVQVPRDAALMILDAGEREAIFLAQELRADLLLMDDRSGRREAVRRHLTVAGTLTVLYFAAVRGLIQDFPATLAQLQETGFRASDMLLQWFLDRYERRMRP